MLTRRALAVGAALLATPRLLRAQTAWPTERPIEAIVPFPPGGGVDVMTRLLLPVVAQHLAANGAPGAGGGGGGPPPPRPPPGAGARRE
ncbi:MAG: hypothetical protein IRY87_25710, partial [Acetobacteraceae bacterium]|nr:hypothetical protein [Acetobacteraceae bacterium]